MKRLLTGAIAAMVLGGLALSPVHAKQDPPAPEIPATVQVDDPAGDANFLNDQDNTYGTPLAGQGDHTGPADVGSATDLLKVWFTNTADEVSLNFQTEAAPGNLAYDVYYRFATNSGTGSAAEDTTRGCLFWVAWVNGTGGGYQGENAALLTDSCNGADPVEGTLTVATGPDESGIVTMTFPRSASPFLAVGGSITTPYGVVRVLNVGPTPTTATAATIDTTQRGSDYLLVEEEPAPVKPPVKKGCKKGSPKAKKKGCKKPPR